MARWSPVWTRCRRPCLRSSVATMADWRFSGQEFEILWSAYGRDRLPYPIRYRPEEMDFADLKRQREVAVTALLGRYAADLERALDVLLEPDVRVESKAMGGADMSTVFRFYGAVRGRIGATAIQLPGTASDTGGDVIVRCCTASEVAEHAAAALPKAPAGTHPPIEVRRAEVTADRERHIHRPYEIGVVAQLDQIFKRERLALGEITVFAGSAVDARPGFGRGFWWMDYVDGRYYVKTGDPIIAKPMQSTVMAAEIQRLTVLTQRYYREDREHDEYLRSQR
ncbi:ESX secretion-associated protein EspG [Nocardia sp. NPDC049220]|uniref:ESX secretion-associated protein EspG n=1 Tax=Nocardia sp. NPDC049220 TaxID=3155273 RepID=UPI0033F6D34D